MKFTFGQIWSWKSFILFYFITARAFLLSVFYYIFPCVWKFKCFGWDWWWRKLNDIFYWLCKFLFDWRVYFDFFMLIEVISTIRNSWEYDLKSFFFLIKKDANLRNGDTIIAVYKLNPWRLYRITFSTYPKENDANWPSFHRHSSRNVLRTFLQKFP